MRLVSQQEAEVRRSDLFVRIESQIAHDSSSALASVVNVVCFGLDFDEGTDSLDGVQRDRVPVEVIPASLLVDRRRWLETDRLEDVGGGVSAPDTRLDFFTRLRVSVDFRSLVGHLCRLLVVDGLTTYAQGLVRLREVLVGRVVVRIRLFDSPEKLGTEFVQTLAQSVMPGSDLHLDLVHTRPLDVHHKNVVLKSATPNRYGMSDESEADAEEQELEDEALEAQDEATEADEDAEPEGFQEGDFVKVAYTARTVEGGDLVDTTDPEVAEEEGVGEDQEFAPRTIVLGQGHLFQAVETDIYGKEVGATGSVPVPAEQAFGEYDEGEVRTVSKDKIPEDDRYPGAHVDVEGEHGHVETIIGGRARVDFNHPLAGEDIEYEYEILSEVEDRKEQAQGVLSMMLDMELDVWFETDTVEEEQVVESDDDDEDAEPETETVEVETDTLYIEATPQLSMNQQWMMGKQQIAQQLTQLLDIDRIIVQEELGGGGMGMPGMMGGAGGADIEDALEDADVDADEIVEEIESAADE